MNALEQLKNAIQLARCPGDRGDYRAANAALFLIEDYGPTIVKLIEAAKTTTFHLRRGDHVGDSGHVCTSSMIESLDAALRKLTENKPL